MGDLVNWLEHTEPVRLTAYATIAVAFAALVSIVANFALAWQAGKSAAASVAAVLLQGEELEVLKRQAKLAEDQFAASRDAARPRLRPAIDRVGKLFIEGNVAYVHGSEPAYEIVIWIRGPSRPDAGSGLYRGAIGFMIAADRQLPFMASPASAAERSECPFPEFLEDLDLEPSDYFIGLRWRRLDDTIETMGYMQTLSRKEPPGVAG